MPIIRGPLLLDAGDPINKGRLGFWPLNEGAGQKPTNIVRPISRAVGTSDPTWGASPLGKAPKFNGTTQYFSDPTFQFPASSGITVSFWANVAGAGSFSGFGIGTVSEGVGSRCQAHLPYDNDLYWDYGNTSTGRINTNISSYYGKWTHYALVNNGVDFKAIYINGVLITSGTTTAGALAAMVGIDIAHWYDRVFVANFYYAGSLALFGVHSRALQQAEIRRLYREPWAGTRRLPRRQTGGAAAYTLAVGAQAYQYAAGAVGLSSARTMGVSPLAYNYAPQPVGLTYRQGAHTLDVEPLEYGYRPANVDLAYSGAVPSVGASRTRRGARRVYLPEPQATAVFHPNALPEELAAHAVKAWKDDEDDETWFLLA